MELCDCVYKWPVTEMISVSNLRARYLVISNSQSMWYDYQTCRNRVSPLDVKRLKICKSEIIVLSLQ
jgi:hypothetical protein